MRYRKVGTSGLEVSVLGLGTNALGGSQHLIKYVFIQPGYSLADRGVERELIPFCLEHDQTRGY